MALREQDVLDMLRLVAEAAAQQTSGVVRCQRLLRGLSILAPARMALTATLSFSLPGRELHVLSAVACGLEEGNLLHIEGPGQEGPARELVLRGIAPMLTRVQAALGEAWALQGTAFTAQMRRQLGFGHYACSVRRRADDGQVHLLAVCRTGAEPAFTLREDQIVHLLHEQVEAMSAPAAASGGKLANLPPYLQRLVPELLAGAGEKQIAARLGFTFNTTHQYIKAIYRRVGVTSRAEFMARCLHAVPGNGGIQGRSAGGTAEEAVARLPVAPMSIPVFVVSRNPVSVAVPQPAGTPKRT
jgi:hypothetical protein